VYANRIKALTNIQVPGELQLSVGLLFAHQQIPLGVPQAQNKCAETTPTFFAWYQFYADSEL
jgi:hypothetical protein